MVPFLQIVLLPYFCFLSLSLVGFVAPMLVLLYVMFVYWFCSQLSYLFSSALFHNCLTLSFWVFVPSIFVMTLHSLTVPIIATIGPLFYVTIWVIWAMLWFPKLVIIHNVNWLGIENLLFTIWMLHFNSLYNILLLSIQHLLSKLGMLILYIHILLRLNI